MAQHQMFKALYQYICVKPPKTMSNYYATTLILENLNACAAFKSNF